MNKYFALAALIFTVSPAYAGDVGEFQAATINLEPFQGIIYYTNESDGYHVVATVAEGETGLPVRFEATLAEAQNDHLCTRQNGRKEPVIRDLKSGWETYSSRTAAHD